MSKRNSEKSFAKGYVKNVIFYDGRQRSYKNSAFFGVLGLNCYLIIKIKGYPSVMAATKLQDKYALLEKIQEGTYGVVFKARNKQTKEIYAIKFFKSFGKIGLPISFIREQYIHEIVESEYLVQLVQVFASESEPAMVMEWLDISLDQAITSGKMIRKKQIFTEMLKGTLHFHNNGLIHRDLKPTNIMLTTNIAHKTQTTAPEGFSQDYLVKIIDYGMAKELPWMKNNMTNEVGSLFFRAPELLLGATSYGEEIDVWSLGCIFYFIQTGCMLFKGNNEIEQLQKIAWILGVNKNNIQSVFLLDSLKKIKVEECSSHWCEIKGSLSEIEVDLLQKMIAFDPAHRLSIGQLLSHSYFQ